MLTTRGYKVISPGAWRQSARAELEFISALLQLCYISSGHRKFDITWFSNAHETEDCHVVVKNVFVQLTNMITWKRQARDRSC